MLTIITICLNNKKDLIRTIESVRNQTNKDFEYIIVDGGSVDGSTEIIIENSNLIDSYLSETDKGIYDAMNKGIKIASNEWIIFMNSGDVFANEKVISNFYSTLKVSNNKSFFYSDTLRSNGDNFRCSKNENRIIHQSLFYRKEIHDLEGYYIISKNFITADFFFFLSCYKYEWQKVNYIISIIDTKGVSNSPKNYAQKKIIESLFFDKSRLMLLGKLILHPIYFRIKFFFSKS
tara:strand:+ start:374 stop:1075 length:702 start_codon:yes stop_codon:yes gene_type:complete